MQDISEQDPRPASPTAAETLVRLLAPIEPAAFVREHWNRQPLFVPGTPGRFHDLVGWDDVNAVLSQHRLEPPRCELVQRGKRVDTERFTFRRGGGRQLDAGSVKVLLEQGATMVLSFVDEAIPALRRLAENLEAALQAHVNVNLYAGWKADHGFDLHWDTHDVFVLQILGRKRWRVFEPTQQHPVRTSRGEAPTPSGEPQWEQVIEDGAMLYIPRGWWHDATPLDEPSLHLTIAVTPPIGRDFLAWIVDQMDRHEIARRDLPRLEGQSSLEVYFDALRAALLAEWDAGAPARFLSARDGDRAAPPRFDLPNLASIPTGGINGETQVRLASVRRLDISGDDTDDRIVVRNGRQHWPCHRALAPALGALTASEARSYSELRALLAEPDREPELRKQLLLLAHGGAVTLTNVR